MTETCGERVILRPTTEADFPNLMQLWNDGRVMRWVGFPDGLGYGPEQLQSWFTKLQSQPERHHYVVHVEGIGFCGEAYYSADKAQRRAGLDIKLLPEAQGRGIATDALTTLISHVFATEPEIDAVWTEPAADNNAARRLYKRCGLRPGPRPADMGEGESYWERRRASLAASA